MSELAIVVLVLVVIAAYVAKKKKPAPVLPIEPAEPEPSKPAPVIPLLRVHPEWARRGITEPSALRMMGITDPLAEPPPIVITKPSGEDSNHPPLTIDGDHKVVEVNGTLELPFVLQEGLSHAFIRGDARSEGLLYGRIDDQPEQILGIIWTLQTSKPGVHKLCLRGNRKERVQINRG